MGLVDLAAPAFTEVGKIGDSVRHLGIGESFESSSPSRRSCLKLHQSRYGSDVWFNGRLPGEHLPCFTPMKFEARAHLRSGGSQLGIWLGARRKSTPTGKPSGRDFEKNLLTPGLYDSGELIVTAAIQP